MKNNPKNVNVPVIVILYLLAVIFLGYGIYMAYDAVIYVNTYDTNNAVSSSNMLQYVVAASASYFGFAIIIFAAASILGAINKVQRNIVALLAFDDYSDEYPEDVMKSAPVEEVKESAPVEEVKESAPVKEVVESAPAEADIESAPVEAAAAATASMESDEMKGEEIPASQTEVPENEPAAEQEVSADHATEDAADPEPEETAVPEVEEAVSPEPEKSVETESKPEKLPEGSPVNVIQPAAPEIIAQQQPTPEIIIKKQPVTKTIPQEAAPQYKPESKSMPHRQTAPGSVPESIAGKPQPPTVPEEILQTKRKRGLKYETVAMEGTKPAAEYTQNLSDTIRLKKEDRDAISSAFIRDIFEKNE